MLASDEWRNILQWRDHGVVNTFTTWITADDDETAFIAGIKQATRVQVYMCTCWLLHTDTTRLCIMCARRGVRSMHSHKDLLASWFGLDLDEYSYAYRIVFIVRSLISTCTALHLYKLALQARDQWVLSKKKKISPWLLWFMLWFVLWKAIKHSKKKKKKKKKKKIVVPVLPQLKIEIPFLSSQISLDFEQIPWIRILSPIHFA